MKEIALNRGYTTTVDNQDFDWLNQWRWHAWESRGKLYVCRSDSRGNRFRMHREIMRPPEGLVVDHIDGNPLNNQRANMRICTQGENVRNRSKVRTRPTSSQYKGVWLSKQALIKPWRAYIRLNGKPTYIGTYELEADAARAYDEAAWEQWGEFAKLNFPKDKLTG